MNFFITGSAGFIGYHVAKTLLESGHNIVGFDNFNDYYSPDLKERRNELLLSYNNFVDIKGDLIDYPQIENILKKYNIDRVCHLAAQAGVRNSINNPFHTFPPVPTAISTITLPGFMSSIISEVIMIGAFLPKT